VFTLQSYFVDNIFASWLHVKECWLFGVTRTPSGGWGRVETPWAQQKCMSQNLRLEVKDKSQMDSHFPR